MTTNIALEDLFRAVLIDALRSGDLDETEAEVVAANHDRKEMNAVREYMEFLRKLEFFEKTEGRYAGIEYTSLSHLVKRMPATIWRELLFYAISEIKPAEDDD